MDEELQILKFPSVRHENFLLQAVRLCLDEGIFLAVSGSILQRNATPFSDLNLIGVGDFDRQRLEKLVNGYGRALMTWVTPAGFYETVYEDALAVGWDLRPAFHRDEMRRIQIVAGEGHYPLSETPTERFKVRSLLFPVRNSAYGILCLLHRAIEKQLGGKAGVSREILAEIQEDLRKMGWEKVPPLELRAMSEEILDKLGPIAMADPAFLQLLEDRLRLLPGDYSG